MPSDAEHDAAYRDNETLLTAGGGLLGTSPRWAAVVAFYAAVHLVERLAAREGQHHVRHTGNNSRQRYLSNHRQHDVILADLTALRSASEIARYDSLAAFQAAFPGNDVQTNLIDGSLSAIRQYVDSVFSPPPPPPAAAAGS